MKKKTVRTKGRKLINAKKVSQNGVQFDSQLELYMYNRLKEEGIKFKYNEIKYLLIPSFKYPRDIFEPKKVKEKDLVSKTTIRKMEYTPDFVGENESWIIETKGRANESFPLRWKMFKHKMLERECPPVLFLPRNRQECEQVITILKQSI